MVQVPNFPVTLRSVGQLSCDMTIKTEINEKKSETRKRGNCECIE